MPSEANISLTEYNRAGSIETTFQNQRFVDQDLERSPACRNAARGHGETMGAWNHGLRT